MTCGRRITDIQLTIFFIYRYIHLKKLFFIVSARAFSLRRLENSEAGNNNEGTRAPEGGIGKDDTSTAVYDREQKCIVVYILTRHINQVLNNR